MIVKFYWYRARVDISPDEYDDLMSRLIQATSEYIDDSRVVIRCERQGDKVQLTYAEDSIWMPPDFFRSLADKMAGRDCIEVIVDDGEGTFHGDIMIAARRFDKCSKRYADLAKQLKAQSRNRAKLASKTS